MINHVPGAGTRPRLLIVEGEPRARESLRHALESLDVEIGETASSADALALLREQPVDLILSDYALAGMNGLHLLAAAREFEPTIGFILVTGGSAGDAMEALRQGADDYIPKPFEVEEVRHAVFRTLHHRRLMRENRDRQAEVEAKLTRQAEEMEGRLVDALLAIVAAIAHREGYNGQHVERVTQYAVATARRMGLDHQQIRQLWIGGMLHDVGKIGIPDEILRKPAQLTPEEDEIMRRHPVIGAGIVGSSEFLRPALPAVLHHHERWDGTRYPDGLSGEAIPLASRILGVAEAFDAIVNARPYRGKRTRSEALSELRRCAGGQFDPAVVDAFIHSFGDPPDGSEIRKAPAPAPGAARDELQSLPQGTDVPVPHGLVGDRESGR